MGYILIIRVRHKEEHTVTTLKALLCMGSKSNDANNHCKTLKGNSRVGGMSYLTQGIKEQAIKWSREQRNDNPGAGSNKL